MMHRMICVIVIEVHVYNMIDTSCLVLQIRGVAMSRLGASVTRNYQHSLQIRGVAMSRLGAGVTRNYQHSRQIRGVAMSRLGASVTRN